MGQNTGTQEKQNAVERIWAIKGIPKPTDDDLKRREAQRKSKNTLFKVFLDACKKGDVWRVAKILEYRALQPESKRFYIQKTKINYSGIEYNICKNSGKARLTIFKLIFSQEKITYINSFSSRCIITRLANAQDWDSLELLWDKGFIKSKDHNYILEKLLESSNPRHLPKLAPLVVKSPNFLEYAVKVEKPDLVKAALKTQTVSADTSLYEMASKYQNQTIFIYLCQAKAHSDQNDGVIFDIPVADKWIEKNVIPQKKIQKSDTVWEKYEDTSIYNNLPVEPNGSRLRDLFDFAAGRVERYQQTKDGVLHFQYAQDFHEYGNAPKLATAEQKLIDQKGTPQVSTVAYRSAISKAKPDRLS